MKLIKVAGAVLNQTPFDWENNKRNILASIDGGTIMAQEGEIIAIGRPLVEPLFH